MSEFQTLKLKTPIEFGDERIEELTFKPLKARHLRSVSAKPTMSDLLTLLEKSTGLSLSQVNELDSRDTMSALDIVSGFLTDGRETGEVS